MYLLEYRDIAILEGNYKYVSYIGTSELSSFIGIGETEASCNKCLL